MRTHRTGKIHNKADLRRARIAPVPSPSGGFTHYRLVPLYELAPRMTASFRKRLDSQRRRRTHEKTEYNVSCAITRRAVAVATRKYKARRRRRR